MMNTARFHMYKCHICGVYTTRHWTDPPNPDREARLAKLRLCPHCVGAGSWNRLVTVASCPKCLSSNTLFYHFRKVQELNGLSGIEAEVHVCLSCGAKFEKSGPWDGQSMRSWESAMLHGMDISYVPEYLAVLHGEKQLVFAGGLGK